MKASSIVVVCIATGAMALGCMGMATAQPPSSHHAGHGALGENLALAPKRLSGGLPKLVGIVNDNRDIEISDRTPSPGRYKIVVRDSAKRHNWHLFRGSDSWATTVRGTGRWVFKVRLTAGNYRVVCDPHSDDMEFDLVVG
ncbi:MAG: hypothetical protein ACJ74E_05265 [Actinomycetes bacterium]